MDEAPKWTSEQLELLETLRSKDEVAHNPALAPLAEALEKDPELAQRLDRILKWDARFTDAIGEVAVPFGLAEKILGNLECSNQPSPQVETTVPERRPRSRRRWMLAVAGVAAAILVVAVVLLNGLPSMSPETLLSMARDRFLENQGNGPNGTALATESAPERFPFSPDLRQLPGTRWRSVSDFRSAEALAYDIPLGVGQKATLYAVRCRANAPLSSRPPASPSMRTQNLAIAAWQGNGLVYVVVVEGGDRAYRAILKSLPQRLA